MGFLTTQIAVFNCLQYGYESYLGAVCYVFEAVTTEFTAMSFFLGKP